MFLELHILQSFAPSNLNRDDIGQPKSTDFGGVRRARISSQCQKRAIRLHPAFGEATGVPLATRTKMITSDLKERLHAGGCEAERADQLATVFAETYSGKLDEKRKGETAVLLYLSDSELSEAAKVLLANQETLSKLAASDEPSSKGKGKKAKSDDGAGADMAALVKGLVKQTENRTSAPDIALYGRMLAYRPETNIDAACQVAHAISTHGIGRMETDYYTAMDDIKQRQNDPSAGFLDVAYFTSACFYRYMRIDVNLLRQTLADADLTRRTVEGFLRAAEAAVPSGKINSHAQHSRPSLMLSVVRPEGSDGWSLVNAFERPIPARNGVVQASADALLEKFAALQGFYGGDQVVIAALALPDGAVKTEALAPAKSLNEWVASTLAAIKITEA
jgi:CRISPR system Cascade subunit CasC